MAGTLSSGGLDRLMPQFPMRGWDRRWRAAGWHGLWGPSAMLKPWVCASTWGSRNWGSLGHTLHNRTHPTLCADLLSSPDRPPHASLRLRGAEGSDGPVPTPLWGHALSCLKPEMPPPTPSMLSQVLTTLPPQHTVTACDSVYPRQCCFLVCSRTFHTLSHVGPLYLPCSVPEPSSM